MEKMMKRAVQLAIDNVNAGGEPFGAVLAKEDEIIAEGVNELHKNHDVSGHAEMLAMRRAQAKLAVDHLNEYTMYASGAPCPMCLAAMYFAGITEIYYCETVDEAVEAGLGTAAVIYDDLKKREEERTIRIQHMPLGELEEKPIKKWLEKHK